MEKIIYQLIVLLLVLSCQSPTNYEEPQSEIIVVKDTVFASKTDSLEWVYATGVMEDKMSACYDLAKFYSDTNLGLSRQYAEDLLRMALSAKNKKREGDAYQRIFVVSQNDSAVFYADKALKIYEEVKEDTLAAHAKLNKGIVLGRLSRNDEALEIMQECLDYYTKNNMESRRASTLQAIGAMYGDMQLHELSNEYYIQALTIYETLDKEEAVLRGMGACYSNSGENFFRLKDYQKALEYSEKALELFRQINDVYYTVNELLLLSTRYLVSERNDEARRYLNEAEAMMENVDNNVLRSEVLKTYGYFHVWSGDYKQALDYTKQALALMDSTNKRAIYILYGLLATYAPFTATPLETQTYVAQFNKAAQAAINEEWSQKLTEVKTKYETEKKELKISALEDEKRLMMWLGITGGTVLLLTLTVLAFLWRWTVQKRRVSEQQRQLAETRVLQLEQEKQLIATQAVLDGETRERSRLARDLHDGLGSMLTGVRLQLIEMKQGAKLEYAEVERFDKALGLLDNSVNEMRRVAHHLMPDSLSRFGLKPAVSDFCSNLPSVQFAYYGDESRLDPKLEVMIYRSIHELVNNALKHAEASRIMVQIIQEPDRIDFTIQDNGCGFDPATVKQGMGLQNIRTRVESYNGVIDIDTKKGTGTEVHVELKLNKK